MADYPAIILDPYNAGGNLAAQDDFGDISLWYWFGNPFSPTPPIVPPVNPPGPSPGVGDPGYQYGELTPIVDAFLGYRPTAGDLENFPFIIYRFIIRALRDRDQNRAIGGTRLLERFLLGPEEVWFNMYRAGSNLNTLYDPEEIEEPYLRSLARLVGFGSDLIDILGTATEEQLRRIISRAIEFWRKRWLDSGVEAAIRMVTGNRFKVRDFFDFRFIVGETRIEEDLRNTDPNMISVKTRNFFRSGFDGITRFDSTPYTFSSLSQLPKTDDIGGFIVIFDDTGSPSLNGLYEIVDVDINAEIWYVDIGDWFPRGDNSLSWFIAFPYDEYLTEVRVVDEKTGQGELDRELLEKLLDLQRPSSERFNVVYVDFMDLFQTPNDLGQWEEITASPFSLDSAIVADGKLTLTSSAQWGGLICTRPTADWETFQWKVKAALGSATGDFAFPFYWQDENNYFQIAIQYTGFGTGIVTLHSIIGGVLTTIGVATHPSLNPETYWSYMVETYNHTSGDVRVRVFVDGNLFIDGTIVGPGFTSGNIALASGPNSEVWIEETELWEYPLDISRVGPNP